MARPKSDEKRRAIMSAAIQIIAAEGLGAATAAIAKRASVSNGALFTYFATKAELLNRLYVELKTEMAVVGLEGLPADRSIREQMSHVWSQWLRWGMASPEKRRALARLGVSDDITPESHQAAAQAMGGIAALLERARAKGPLRDVPLGFVAMLMSGVGDATLDFVVRDPDNGNKHGAAAFDSFWRMIV